MQLKTHPFAEEELMAYLDGELSLNEAERVEEHLAGCDECRGVVEDLKHLSGAMKRWKAPGVRADWTAPAVPQKRRFRWEWAAVAAGVIGVFGIGLGIRHRPAIVDYSAPSVDSLQQRQATTTEPAPDVMLMDRAGQIQKDMPAMAVRIAREANLAITVERFDDARGRMEQMVKARGGFVSELAMNRSAEEAKSLTATLKVPAAELDALYRDLRTLGHVDTESQRGEDVTRQSVDTDARLANLRETEKRLTAILQQRTGKLSDVLEVEEQIARVRGEIETTEAEQKALANRVALASVRVTMTERYRKPAGTDHAAISTRLRNAAVDGWQTLVDLVEGCAVLLLTCGPVLLVIGAITIWPGRLLWRKLRGAA